MTAPASPSRNPRPLMIPTPRRLEVVGADAAGTHGIAAGSMTQRMTTPGRANDAFQRSTVLLKSLIRERILAGIHESTLVGPAQGDKSGCRDALCRFRNEPVRNGKDRCVAADDERDEEHRRCTERGGGRQNPAAGPDILQELLECGPRPDGARVFARERDVAKHAARVGLRALGAFAAILAKPASSLR